LKKRGKTGRNGNVKRSRVKRKTPTKRGGKKVRKKR